MKKGIGAVIVIVLLFFCAGNIQHYYTRKNCEVVGSLNGIAYIKDMYGHTWKAKVSHLKIGDKVDLRMFNGCTDLDYTDDKIVKIKLK